MASGLVPNTDMTLSLLILRLLLFLRLLCGRIVVVKVDVIVVAEHEEPNAHGDRKGDGRNYYAAYVPGTGLSLFELK